MTLSLPQHWENRFKEILTGIPRSQKFIGVEKLHQVIGDLRSMVITLPGTRGILIHMQESLQHVDGKHVALTRGVNQSLA